MTSPSIRSVVSSDGTLLAYRTLGEPSARPLVLVHGWAQSSACWGRELLDALAREFRVVAVDLRGHGHSQAADAGYDSPEQWADDLAAVLDAEGIGAGAGAGAGADGHAILLGWSYGGIVVSDYLARRGTDGVAGIVLCAAVTSISRSAGGAVGPAMMQVADGGFDADPATALAALTRFGSALMRPGDGDGAGDSDGDRDGDGADRQRLLGLSLATPPQVRRRMLSRRVDNDATLRGLTIPALVVHGAEDGVVPPETGRANAEMIAGARYVEFADCAHAPFLERREEFLAALTEFAAGL